ncbi:MAG: hypothetical protein U5K77_02635 [Candidatus Saccharibacteria bacterium]|nr:hypothetical protein [Candidatus Saccharibacteria bacterium]
MINLLPPDLRESIAYARKNYFLLRWSIATFIGFVGILVVISAGYFYMNVQTDAYAAQVEQGKDNLTRQDLTETQERVQEIDSSIQLALQVLSREIQFSQLLRAIGGIIPSGAALQSLSISNVEGGLDLQVVAVDFQTATQVQVNLEDPNNQVFSQADINNVSCSENQDSQYPCQVSVRALFSDDSPFLFSNVSDGRNE